MKLTKSQLSQIIKEEITQAWEAPPHEADLESLYQNPQILRGKEQQLIGLMQEALGLLKEIHDYHHMKQVEPVLASMRKVYERE